MNALQIHLSLLHFPIALTIIALVPAAVGWFKNHEISRSAGALLLVASSLFAIPTYLSGDSAKERVKYFDGVSKAAIEEHDKAAGYALFFLEFTGALSLAYLVLLAKCKPVPKYFYLGVLISALFTSTVVARTAHLGGLIRHEELRISTGAISP